MKPLTIVLVALLFSVPAFAQLNGIYGGTARGLDVNGQEVQQIARFTFVRGQLTSFSEVFLFQSAAPNVTPCEFSASGALAYSNFATIDENKYFTVSAFGCPNGSLNQRPESLIVLPERGTTEFDYMEYTNPTVSPVDEDTPAHMTGHAIRK